MSDSATALASSDADQGGRPVDEGLEPVGVDRVRVDDQGIPAPKAVDPDPSGGCQRPT